MFISYKNKDFFPKLFDYIKYKLSFYIASKSEPIVALPGGLEPPIPIRHPD